MPAPVVSRAHPQAAAAAGRVESLITSVLLLMDRAGSRRPWAVLSVGVAVVLVRLALLPVIPIPHPWVADEFSNLLEADTFASGRLTNPTPHHWRSFEAVHVLLQPTYASKYPPGQPAFLALGQVLFGNPYWGVVLSMALFCAAVCWMLQALVSPGWALFGGMLSFALFGINHYWMQSYWGGAVAGIGGCLITGSVFRMLRKGRPEHYAWPLCAGIPFVIFTRPFEGFVFGATAFILVSVKLWRQRESLHLPRLVVPCLITGFCVLSFQAYYDWRVTGSPLTLPYVAHEQAYSPTPSFWFLPLRTNVPRPSDPVIYSDHWQWEMVEYNALAQMPLWHRVAVTMLREGMVIGISFGALTLIFLLVPIFLSDSQTRSLVILVVPNIVAGSLTLWGYAHYLAPAIPAMIALICVLLQKLRTLRTRAGFRIGTPVTGVLLIMIGVFVWAQRPSTRLIGSGFIPLGGKAATLDPDIARLARERDDLIAKLNRSGEKHLIIVHYSPDHGSLPDWVHNGANIDAQSVIWARDRGIEENRELMTYYRGRRIWELNASGTAYTLGPYDPQPGSREISTRAK